MSIWTKLLGIGGAIAAPFTGGASLIPTIAGAAGSVLSGASNASAANRGAGIEAATLQEQLSQARQAQAMRDQLAVEASRLEGLRSGAKNAATADYVISGGRPYTAPVVPASHGKPLPTYGFGPKAPGSAEIENAYALADANRQRMAAGGSLVAPPKDSGPFEYSPDLLKAGGLEKWGGILGTGLTGVGGIMQGQQQQTRINDALDALDPQSRAVALAAIANLTGKK